jgi:signal transduction histidine kinase
MSLGIRNELAVYLGELCVITGAALLVFDAVHVVPRGIGSRAVADLALVAAGLTARGVARLSHREAPVAALACLVIGALVAAWLTERWWIPAAAGAVAAAVAPQFLPAKRAVVWAVAGALMGAAGIAAGPVTAAVAAAAIAATGAVSFRLARVLRGTVSRPAVELEQALEMERLRSAEILARLHRMEGRERGGARRSVLRAALSRRLGVVQAVAQTIARDLKRAAALGAAETATAASRNAARAEQLAHLAAGGEARERETTLALVWPRVLDHIGTSVLESHHFEIAIPEGLAPVAGGTEEWSQMLAALVENALEAMPGGGVITVRADNSDRPGYARVVIRDNGPGIPADVLPHVLEPYHTSRAEQGAEGLGLATVASLIEALEGDVHVTSSDAGTTVELEVPYYAAAAARGRGARGRRRQGIPQEPRTPPRELRAGGARRGQRHRGARPPECEARPVPRRDPRPGDAGNAGGRSRDGDSGEAPGVSVPAHVGPGVRAPGGRPAGARRRPLSEEAVHAR